MGGNLLNTGPHPLDQALQLFGTDIMPEIFCHMDRTTTAGNAEDHVLVILRGKDRPLIHLEISSCKTYSGNLYEVYGTTGGLKGSMTEIEWQYFDPKKSPSPKLILKPLCKPDGTPAFPSDAIEWIKKSWQVPKSQADLFSVISKRFYHMLWRTLAHGAPLEITPEQIRQQVAVIEECQKQNPQIYRKVSIL
jgi:predicted dehydrogenase